MKSYRIVFSDRASRDLIAIEDYYFPLNPAAARKLIAQISGSINMLALFPDLGPESSEPNLRYHVSRGYRVYYRPDHTEKIIGIVTIFDTRSDPNSLKL
jgi:plasmid stabilization system protein ParE